MAGPIEPKVTSGAVSAAVGGGSLATLLIWGLQAGGIPGEQFTAERVIAITAVLSGASSFIGGWLKRNGINIDGN